MLSSPAENDVLKKFIFKHVGAGKITILGYTLGDSDPDRKFDAILLAPDGKKTPHKHSQWVISDNTNYPIARIESPVSEDGNKVFGRELKLTASKGGQPSFVYKLKHVANAKEGEEV